MKYMPCGVDLGQKGGIVAIDENREILFHRRTPMKNVHVRNLMKSAGKKLYVKSTKKIYNSQAFTAMLTELRELAISKGYIGPVVVVEEATVRTGISSPKTYFSTGGCLNAWHDALNAMDIKFFMVAPITWKSELSIPSDKEKSLERFSTFEFKNVPDAVAKDDNLAEAAMIAFWLMRSMQFGEILNGENPYLYDRNKRIGRIVSNPARKNSGVQGSEKLQKAGADRPVRRKGKKGVGGEPAE